jgi:hypothetical protein
MLRVVKLFSWPKEDIVEDIKFFASVYRTEKVAFLIRFSRSAFTQAGCENDIHQVLTSWERCIALTAERNIVNLRTRLEYFRASCLVKAALQ